MSFDLLNPKKSATKLDFSPIILKMSATLHNICRISLPTLCMRSIFCGYSYIFRADKFNYNSFSYVQGRHFEIQDGRRCHLIPLLPYIGSIAT